ncbi:MAG: transglycosylase domain-containing protein [Alphaproteobacteria bacterium]
MRLRLKHIAWGIASAGFVLAMATAVAIKPVKSSLQALRSEAQTLQITDRAGQPLTISYQNRWNVYDNLPLYAIPQFLQEAFIVAEDKRFFGHGGVDWQARGSALVQNWTARHVVRGASTITEQVVRMINPRPRNIWSKWVEGWEAALLEASYAKPDILEFYLNQLPYASNRRGVAQAARFYFNRDLATLNPREMLALAVLARAPSSYDLYNGGTKIDAAITRLAASMVERGVMKAEEAAQLTAKPFELARPAAPIDALHFAQYVRGQPGSAGNIIHSTLDSNLQAKVQGIIDTRVAGLSRKNLHNAAVLVADHTTGEILAWVVAGDEKTKLIDAVTVPRQPGSAQKPLLYAMALDKGWTPATIIDDSPLAGAVGTGLHWFKNYSNTYYGRITLREALANSLNIPAVRTIGYVGASKYLNTLHRLGFESLDRGVEVYDEGLALGNGEVTLLELVTGFTALANKGVYRPLRYTLDDAGARQSERIWSAEAASLIGNILSDPYARRLEFGAGSVLNLPVQTAAKTGTSTDYRDAWSVGYNHKYVVGIWMGNLDHSPTDGVTGASGPALALRSVFNELNKHAEARPLWLSPKLSRKDVCIEDPEDPERCHMRSEYFMEGGEAKTATAATEHEFAILKPTDGLQMAIDPRIPHDFQKFQFVMHGLGEGQQVEWILNGEPVATSGGKYLWPVRRGKYKLSARVKEGDKTVFTSADIGYLVK